MSNCFENKKYYITTPFIATKNCLQLPKNLPVTAFTHNVDGPDLPPSCFAIPFSVKLGINLFQDSFEKSHACNSLNSLPSTILFIWCLGIILSATLPACYSICQQRKNRCPFGPDFHTNDKYWIQELQYRCFVK